MAYIATDLDAFDDAQGVAGATALPVQQILGGLALMWRWCWRQKLDRVTSEQVAGFFGCPAGDLRGALAAFSFLELGPESHRVRGVHRYLHLSAARSAAGKVRAANAKRGKKGRLESSTHPAHAGEPSSMSPAADQPLQRRATSDERRDDNRSAPASPSPFRIAQVACETVYADERKAKYLWQGAKDTEGLKRLLGLGVTAQAISEGFRLLLGRSEWPMGSTVAQLSSVWNDLTAPPKSAGRAVSGRQKAIPDPNQGIITNGGRESQEDVWEAVRENERMEAERGGRG